MPFLLPSPVEISEVYQRYLQLTMPPGALEGVFAPVLKVLAHKETTQRKQSAPPFALRFMSLVFAADHGVAAHHPVSAFPQTVTAQMLLNFVAGGAAMSVLAKQRNAPMAVCDVGVAHPYNKPIASTFAAGKAQQIAYFDRNLAQTQSTEQASDLFPYRGGSRDLSVMDALEPHVFQAAFAAGSSVFAAMHAKHNADVVILGDMGIGNTTAAAAIIAHCTGASVGACTGHGTGISEGQRRHKEALINLALERHRRTHGHFQAAALGAAQGKRHEPEVVLASLGGFELAALAGAACAAAQAGVFILLDGVITTAALLPYALSEKSFVPWLIAAHAGSEPAHGLALQAIGLSPLLSLGFRLGEGSGAGFAAGLLADAVALLNQMATFESAGVSVQ